MRQKPTLLSSIRETVFGDPYTELFAKVEKATHQKAQLVADAEFNRTMANFYTERVMNLDPHTQWWEFAQAKDKQYEYQMEYVALERRIEEAEKKVQARTEQFHSLKEKTRERA